MELLPLGKKLLLIPTPGQAEQEYLAKYCQEKGYAPYLSQQDFSLSKAFKKIQEFTYAPYLPPSIDLDQWIKNWLHYSQ